jgi:hypothetical protein
MPDPLEFLWPGPFGFYARFLGVSVARSLWFLCQVPCGSCAEFPVDMTSFPKLLMPISLWFLGLVPVGSFVLYGLDAFS